MAQFEIIRDKENDTTNISVLVDGLLLTADQKHPNFIALFTGLHSESMTDSEIRALFDIGFAIGQKFERISKRITISNGNIYVDGKAPHDALTDQIFRFWSEGHDFEPLVIFWEKLQSNPNEHSVEHLYRWLQRHAFTIMPDGDILAYKGVQADFTSHHAGRAIVDGVYVDGNIPNKPGSIIEMPREEVVFDPHNGCAVGLHAGTWSFASSFQQSPITVAVKIDPADVVSVPTEASDAKMRIRRYEVMEAVTAPYGTALAAPESLREDLDAEVDFSDEELFDSITEAIASPESTAVLTEDGDEDNGEDYAVDPPGLLSKIRNLLDRTRKEI